MDEIFEITVKTEPRTMPVTALNKGEHGYKLEYDEGTASGWFIIPLDGFFTAGSAVASTSALFSPEEIAKSKVPPGFLIFAVDPEEIRECLKGLLYDCYIDTIYQEDQYDIEFDDDAFDINFIADDQAG